MNIIQQRNKKNLLSEQVYIVKLSTGQGGEYP
jgi:hypothetical protein